VINPSTFEMSYIGGVIHRLAFIALSRIRSVRRLNVWNFVLYRLILRLHTPEPRVAK
jgi:hypothetical protein